MNDTLTSLQQNLLTGSYIRSLNYHNTPTSKAAWYEQQLACYAQHFSGVGEADLDIFLTTGCWPKDKPGLIHAFYNGYRNNYEVMKPLLERNGFVGWFFVPSDFASTEPAQQRAFAESQRIRLVPDEYPDGRFALSWQEIRDLDQNHVVGSHTKTHSLLALESPENMQREVEVSQQDFEKQLGHKVSAFVWLFGSEYGVHPEADAHLLTAGYKYLFSNFKIQKLR